MRLLIANTFERQLRRFCNSFRITKHGNRIPRTILRTKRTANAALNVYFYHLLELEGVSRAVLQRLDHAGIFALIAGTFTPAHAILFTGFWRWGFLIAIWSLAIAGITLKSIFFNELTEWVGLMGYLGLGWLGIFSAYVTHRLHGFSIIKPLLYGALAYTVGATLEFLRLPIVIAGVIGPHELFHVAVLSGLAWHWIFIRNLLILEQRDSAASTVRPA